MKFLQFLFLAFSTILVCEGQSATGNSQASYGVSVLATPSSSASVVTIQGNQIAGVRLVKTVALKGFDITCSVACTVTLERDGTQATATAASIVPLNGESAAATALAFSGSNAGVGTVLAQYSLAAGGQIAINLSGKFLYSGFENLTVRTSSITGTVVTNIQFSEQ